MNAPKVSLLISAVMEEKLDDTDSDFLPGEGFLLSYVGLKPLEAGIG